MKTIRQNKFLIISLVMLVIISIVDIRYTYKAFDNAYNQIISMLIIVPPIFILIGLFDVWVPKETVIKLMGEKSGARGMFLAFFLGAFSAGPTIAAFPLAMIMLKKGASYSNVIFFLMVWSSLKLPIVFYQITTLGLKFSMVINTTMLIVFIISALLTSFIFTKEEKELFHEKALNS
ncbi:permease [Liberiplasma polymorphum]|uniref:permease n=1 Tax=Liberiplasma polymorphum TaxID=3374570 RepID=UPI0037710290